MGYNINVTAIGVGLVKSVVNNGNVTEPVALLPRNSMDKSSTIDCGSPVGLVDINLKTAPQAAPDHKFATPTICLSKLFQISSTTPPTTNSTR